MQIILSNVSSEFVLLCKKAAPLLCIQATPQLVLSALIGNFANKVACFSRIVSHPIAKSHIKPWSVRGHDITSPTVLFVCFRTIEQVFSGVGHGFFGLILAAPLILRSTCTLLIALHLKLLSLLLDEVYVKPINEVFARHKLSTCRQMSESFEFFQRLKKTQRRLQLHGSLCSSK